MKAIRQLLAGLAVAPALSFPALAGDAFDGLGLESMPSLTDERGGTASLRDYTAIGLGNGSAFEGTNNGSITMDGAAIKASGQVAPATVTGNSGITTVLQNTGDMVNISNATNVNIYMR